MASLPAQLAVLILGFALSSAATAQISDLQVADFEDVPTLRTSFVLPTKDDFVYAGLRWKGFYVINADHGLTQQFPRSGYRTGKVSGQYACVGALRSVVHSEIRTETGVRFDVSSLYLTAAWRNGLLVRLEGLQDGKSVVQEDLTLQGGERQHVELGFEDLDAFRISAAGGEDAGLCEGTSCSQGPEVVIDDVVFRLRPQAQPPPTATTEITEVQPPQPASSTPPPEPSAQPEPVRAVPTAPAPKTKPAGASEIAHRKENQIASGVCGARPYYGAQVGAFSSRKNALAIAAKLRDADTLVQIHEKAREGKDPLYFVIAGCFEEKRHAAGLVKSIQKDGIESFVTRASIRSLGPLVQD